MMIMMTMMTTVMMMDFVLTSIGRDNYSKSMKMIGLSSGISIFVGLIALFALGVITFVVVR